jgi:hypothetical protein
LVEYQQQQQQHLHQHQHHCTLSFPARASSAACSSAARASTAAPSSASSAAAAPQPGGRQDTRYLQVAWRSARSYRLCVCLCVAMCVRVGGGKVTYRFFAMRRRTTKVCSLPVSANSTATLVPARV